MSNILSILLEEELEKQKHPLFEGRGMSFRSPGDVFQNKNGETLEFVGVHLFPPKGGSYPTPDDTQDAIDLIGKKKLISIEQEVNSPNRAAMMVVLQDEASEKYGYVRYFASMNADGKGKWAEKNFAQDTGYSRGDGSKVTTTSLENMLIKPSDLVGDEKERTVQELGRLCVSKAKGYAKEGVLPEMVVQHVQELFRAALAGTQSPVLQGAGPYAAAYNKYLGEILAPVSLVSNWIATGDREASEKVLLDGINYEDMKIKFSMSANEKLVDSKLVSEDGQVVGISSKAGKGAAATTTTLIDILKLLKKNDPRAFKAFIDRHKEFYEVIETIARNNWFDGPVELAKNYGMLSSVDLKTLSVMRENPNMTLQDFKRNIKMTKNLTSLAMQLKGISPMDIPATAKGYEPVYHVISGIAKAVVAKINQSGTFDKGVRAALNRSGMVQVNSSIKVVNKQDAMFVSFAVKYPPDFSGKVVADAAKNYSATRIRGKISFKMI